MSLRFHTDLTTAEDRHTSGCRRGGAWGSSSRWYRNLRWLSDGPTVAECVCKELKVWEGSGNAASFTAPPGHAHTHSGMCLTERHRDFSNHFCMFCTDGPDPTGSQGFSFTPAGFKNRFIFLFELGRPSLRQHAHTHIVRRRRVQSDQRADGRVAPETRQTEQIPAAHTDACQCGRSEVY